LFAAVLAGSVLAACGSDSTSSAPAATQPPATTSTGATSSPAPSALQFSADLVGGGQVDLRSYAGKTLALWFWAPT
jgi:hypothetical protein